MKNSCIKAMVKPGRTVEELTNILLKIFGLPSTNLKGLGFNSRWEWWYACSPKRSWVQFLLGMVCFPKRGEFKIVWNLPYGMYVWLRHSKKILCGNNTLTVVKLWRNKPPSSGSRSMNCALRNTSSSSGIALDRDCGYKVTAKSKDVYKTQIHCWSWQELKDLSNRWI